MEGSKNLASRPWLGFYLRVLAAAMAYGGIVHIANMLGFGERHWLEGPLAWRLGDLFYAPLDLIAAVGLWLRRPWGVVLFLVAVTSQFVLYTVFIEHFALTLEHRRTIQGLLGTQALLTLGLVTLWTLKR